MTREEFAKLISAIKAYYQSDNMFRSAEVAEVWYRELEDIDYQTATKALRRYVQTNKFPPHISDIRNEVADAKVEDEGWSKGWKDMRMAIRKFGYTQERAALESLDPITREATRRLGWQEICETEKDKEAMLRANFRMIYEQVADRQKQIATLSSDLIERKRTPNIEAVREKVKRLEAELNND